MGKRNEKSGADRDTPRFVQVMREPSIGVETGRGRAWVGVDQQVGHGSADALYLLDERQYVEGLRDPWTLRAYQKECWEGRHRDRRLFEPAGGSWRPARWTPARTRILPPSVDGEIWHHIDALGQPAGSELRRTSRLLVGDAGVEEPGVTSTMTFRLHGDAAYPRPAALIAGLDRGSTRDDVRAVLGGPSDAHDGYIVEGVRIGLAYDDTGLSEVSLERLESGERLPEGAIGTILDALGETEEGPAYRAMSEVLAGDPHFWASSGRPGRRLTQIGAAAEIQVERDEVLSVHVGLGQAGGSAAVFEGISRLPHRTEVHAALGSPLSVSANVELYRYGNRQLLVAYGVDDVVSSVRAVLSGRTPSDRFYRWRAGWFTRFVDILGRDQANPLVAWARGLDGVSVGMRGGTVSDVEVGPSVGADRFVLFLEGTPPDPTPSDIRFGSPVFLSDSDAVWDLGTCVVHARLGRDGHLTSIAVRQETPRALRR